VNAGRNPHFFAGITKATENLSTEEHAARSTRRTDGDQRRLGGGATVKADSRRRRWPQASLYSGCPPSQTRIEGRSAGGRNYSASDRVRPGICVQRVESLPDLTDADSARRICVAACADGVSCRMFLCGCCRSQVLVCRCCDRGQIYCIKTCAQKVRADRQREARRRYQATPRGRAGHAERNRRYRARMRCVTDHGLADEPEGLPSPNLDGGATLSQPAPTRKSPGLSFCHNCGRSASAFLRRSPLRTRRHRESKRQIGSSASRLRRGP